MNKEKTAENSTRGNVYDNLLFFTGRISATLEGALDFFRYMGECDKEQIHRHAEPLFFITSEYSARVSQGMDSLTEALQDVLCEQEGKPL